jgi:hypothetical protein
MAPNLIEERWDRDRKACSDDKQFGCTVLEADFRTAGIDPARPTARLVFRIAPEGIAPFTQQIAAGVVLAARNTQATDMAASIADLSRRTEMLTLHRDRLVELSKRSNATVDDLLKISSELGRTQSQLEEIAAERAKIGAQVEREHVTVFYGSAPETRGRFAAIDSALSNFLRTLAENTGAAIRFVAAAIPWIPVVAAGVALLYLGIRLLRRRRTIR